MHPIHEASAATMGARLTAGPVAPAAFRAALLGAPLIERDAWLDRVLGLGEIPPDGPALPRGGVPYLPCPVHALLPLIAAAAIGPDDVVVDIGAGVGRALAAVHLLTGARGVGVEIQPALVADARALAARFGWAALSFVEGDAAERGPAVPGATVFLLYCPFSGARLDRLLAGLAVVARDRPIRVACVDLPPLARPWLATVEATDDAVVYRSR